VFVNIISVIIILLLLWPLLFLLYTADVAVIRHGHGVSDRSYYYYLLFISIYKNYVG